MSARKYPLTPSTSPLGSARDKLRVSSTLALLGAREWAALGGVVLFMLALAFSPACAQDPVSGALATLAAATVQAQYRQAAQLATRQAVSAEATATAQAYQARAATTAQAQAAKATDQALEATRQAMGLEATQAASAAQVQATDRAQAIRATDTAYQQEQAGWERQERVARYAERFLYVAFGLGFLATLVLFWRAYRAMGVVEPRVVLPVVPPNEASGEWVIEGEYNPANQRGLHVTVINDPGAVERFEQFVMENGL
ncbi:MAG: hypothetical protein JW850_02580 [Thermoflexales bacterium]|nr:hypothetical protein [Thermoflexales bacterium]